MRRFLVFCLALAGLSCAPVTAQQAPAVPVCIVPAMPLDGLYPHARPDLQGTYVVVARVDGTIVSVKVAHSSGNPAFDADVLARLRTSDCRNASRVKRVNPADVRAVVEVPVTVSASARAFRVR